MAVLNHLYTTVAPRLNHFGVYLLYANIHPQWL